MALPALSAPDVKLTILNQREEPDGRGLVIGYRARTRAGASSEHVARCRFRAAGRPLRSEDLVGIEIDGEVLSDANRYFLTRFWLATPEARAGAMAFRSSLAVRTHQLAIISSPTAPPKYPP